MEILITLNRWAERWSDFAIAGLLDASVILILASILWLLVHKKASPQFGYGLFLLVLFKLLIPVEIAAPVWMTYLSPTYTLTQAVRPASAEREYIPSSATSGFADARIVPVESGFPSASPSPASLDSSLSSVNPLPPAPRPALTVQSKLMLAWAFVVIALLSGFAGMQVKARKLFNRAARIDLRALPVDFLSLKQRAGVAKPIDIRLSGDISSPIISGILHPRLILPMDLRETLTANQLTWVILHELAHIRRFDLLVSLFQRIAQIVFFYNPAVWIANWAANQLREYACDDAALAVCGAPRRDCGEGFLNLVERANSQDAPVASALGLFNPGTLIRQRLLRILDTRRRIQHKLSWSAALLLALLAIVVLPIVRAEQTENSALSREPDAGMYTFKGTIFNETNQQPISGAKVVVLKPRYFDIPNEDGEKVIAEGETNASGEFEIAGIPAGIYTFFAQAPGYIEYHPRGDIGIVHPHERIFLDRSHPVADVRVPMRWGYGVRVRVLNATGQPVENAVVIPLISKMYYGLSPCKTGANGECVFDSFLKENGRVLVRHENGGEAFSDLFQPGDTSNPPTIVVQLFEPASISGRVTFEEGTPVAHMPLYATLSGIYQQLVDTPGEIFHETQTDENGYYRFDGLGQGEYDLRNVDNHRKREVVYNYINDTISLKSGEEKKGVNFQTFCVPLEGEIKGRVLASDGAPIANAKIEINVKDTDLPDTYRGTVIHQVFGLTNENGEFHLKNFSKPKTAEVESSAKGFLTTKQTYDRFDKPIEMVMQPAGTIRGIVLDEGTQKPIIGAVVRLYRSFSSNESPSAHDYDSLFCPTGDDGSFTLESVNAIPVRLITEAPGYLKEEGSALRVQSGDNLGPISISLKRGSVIYGLITDASGTPIANASIGLRSKARNPNINIHGASQRVEYGEAVLSKVDGSFEIAGVPPDDFLIVRHPDYAPKCLQFTPDVMNEETLSVILTQGGVLEGTVLDSEGKPAQGEKINICNFPENSFTYQATIDEKGNYRLERLPAIQFEVRAGTIWANDSHFNEVRTVTIVDGSTTRADFGTGEGNTITGTVYKNGKPERNVQVSLQSDYGPFGKTLNLTTESDENGRYTIRGVPEGEWLIQTWQGGDTEQYQSVTVSPGQGKLYQKVHIDPSQTEYHVDLHIKAHRVIVTVCEAETGKPIPDLFIGTAHRPDSPVPYGLYLRGKTDEKGMVTLYPKETGTHTLQVWETGYIPQNVIFETKSLAPGETESEMKIEVRLRKAQTQLEVHLSLDGQPYISDAVNFYTYVDGYLYPFTAESIPDKQGAYRVRGLPEGESDLHCSVYEEKARFATPPESVTIKNGQHPVLLLSLLKTGAYQFVFTTQRNESVDRGFAQVEFPDFPQFNAQYNKIRIQNGVFVETPLGNHPIRIIVPGYKPLELIPEESGQPDEYPNNVTVVNLTLEKE